MREERTWKTAFYVVCGLIIAACAYGAYLSGQIEDNNLASGLWTCSILLGSAAVVVVIVALFQELDIWS